VPSARGSANETRFIRLSPPTDLALPRHARAAVETWRIV
jgi:hypothetical protein